ncbi:hypothetical protein DSO57_1015258 [Entomophthora muscae]|uniref:Uncharacterized protein n=1 Tax=Entomophthora muscae TaxID=34485 RepID=A0ACC2T5E1_9FUNG|nr:hypothetical protein DSO57_1015258 [Entomophthora muscae]
MGICEFFSFLCCGSSGSKEHRANNNHVHAAKPKIQTYPTLNDIPLGEWQDTNSGQVYKPGTIHKPATPTSTISSSNSASTTFPTSEELSNLRLAIEKLWSLDSNRLNPGLDYELYLHKATNNQSSSHKLFRYVNEPRILTIPTYKYFYDLMDNYHSETGVEEVFGAKEEGEIEAFLKAFSQTKPGQYLHQYLVAKRLCSGDPITFRRMLYDIWFKLYRRGGKNDSSAFEHVFLGEIREGEVIGFHNWLFFYYEEKAQRLNYHGYVPPHHSHVLQNPSGKEHLLTTRFTWKDCCKSFSSGFVGTSPEFEFALYTLCFLTKQERVAASLSGFETDIIVHSFLSRGSASLGPAILQSNKQWFHEASHPGSQET